MTDGKNEYPDDNDLDGLIRQLGDQALEGGVRVFTIAYGKDADLDTPSSASPRRPALPRMTPPTR